MGSFIAKTLLVAATTAFAAPTTQLEARQLHNASEQVEAWDAGGVTEYTIHESCNATQASQIADGLREAVKLADHAKKHILRWGNSSELYQKYFGNDPPYTAIGSFDILVNGDKAGVIFRCDNPDGNCAQEGKLRLLPLRFELTSTRLGWALERRERHSRDGHLRSVV